MHTGMTKGDDMIIGNYYQRWGDLDLLYVLFEDSHCIHVCSLGEGYQILDATQKPLDLSK
jgi:hypothetical protein